MSFSRRPKLADLEAWNQAEQAMQPALIRTLDHLRQQLEALDWPATYEEGLRYPPGTPPEVQAEGERLRQELAKTRDPVQVAQLEAAIAELPPGAPAYWLRVERGGRSHRADLWEMCYQICFVDYAQRAALAVGEEVDVEMDRSLFDEEGELDWYRLDAKAGEVVAALLHQWAAAD